MNIKQDGILDEVVGQFRGREASPTSYRESPSNVTEAVIAAYTKACRSGAGTGQNAFDIAVRTYLGRFPGTHPNAAARIVAPKADFEVPRPTQRQLVHRIGKQDQHGHQHPVGQHQAAFVIRTVSEDLDRSKGNLPLHNLENKCCRASLQKNGSDRASAI